MLDAAVVGRVIQDYREQKGLSQEVVSGFADIGRTHLSAIEGGKDVNKKLSRLIEDEEITMAKIEELLAAQNHNP